MSKFRYNDIELYYRNEGSGEPLVLLSGLGSKMSWNYQIPFFKQKMRVIAPHNRGAGRSSRPNYPYTMDMFVEDLKQLLDHLGIQKNIHLCGLSMGGMIAQNFILKYPQMIKTLILCATFARNETGSSKSIIEAQKLMENFDLEHKFRVRAAALYSRPFRKKMKQDKELFESLKQDFMEDPITFQDWVNQGAAVSEHNTEIQLHTIKQPTLILLGDDDHIIPTLKYSKILHEKIPNSRLKIIEGVGHRFTDEKPDIVNNIIWNFIKEYLE
ncbi:MAG: alpha/beta hydrolase [Promethearchaeota archaeon]|nr:MAG: alpha/beta hydrolase [Candidatus Lokiarchaeota archaeon]